MNAREDIQISTFVVVFVVCATRRHWNCVDVIPGAPYMESVISISKWELHADMHTIDRYIIAAAVAMTCIVHAHIRFVDTNSNSLLLFMYNSLFTKSIITLNVYIYVLCVLLHSGTHILCAPESKSVVTTDNIIIILSHTENVFIKLSLNPTGNSHQLTF